jgi:antitoxin PrlF
MSLIAKVTSKGQTTLPAQIRADLGILPGDRIRYEKQEDGSYRMQKLSGSFADLRGIIKLDRDLSMDEILDAVDQARAAIGGVGDRS